MKEAIIIFAILLVLLLIISVFGGSIRYTPTAPAAPAPGFMMPANGMGYPMGYAERYTNSSSSPPDASASANAPQAYKPPKQDRLTGGSNASPPPSVPPPPPPTNVEAFQGCSSYASF